MRALKTILAVALAGQLLVACSKGTTNTNTNTNTSTTNTKTTTPTTANTANTTSKATGAGAPAQKTGSGDNHYTHAEGGIQFDLPAGWKAEPKGDQMVLSTEDGSLSVVLWVTSEDNFEEAVAALDDELGKTMKNVKESGEPKETTVSGMDAVSSSGTGEIEGSEIQWAVDMIKAKKPVIVLSFAAPGVWEKHQGAYKQFANSIKPA